MLVPSITPVLGGRTVAKSASRIVVVIPLSLLLLLLFGLGPHKTVHLQHANLKIAGWTQRRIVERLAAIGFAKPNVLVHPDRLALAARRKHFPN